MRIEIRNDSVILDGYVNATGRESRILPSPRGKFKEQIVPKTFEKALMKAKNVDLLFNHLKDRKLGSILEGNLELREDNIGLRAIATVSDPEVMEKAKNSQLQGWSFGMFVIQDKWFDADENGIQKRMIEDIELIEVSILDKTPAYIATSIEARGEEILFTENRNEEFTPNIVDKTEVIEKDNDVEERQAIDYSILDNEMTILHLKGCSNK
jgi:uncharacterized protein